MFKMWKWLVGILVIAVLAGITLQFASLFSPVGRSAGHSPSIFQRAAHLLFPGNRAVDGTKVSERDRKLEMSEETVSRLRAVYGGAMEDPGVQVRAIEEIRRILVAEFPKTWHARMNEVLYMVFPEKQGQLAKVSAKLDRYNAWLEQNWGGLLGLRSSERNAILWGKRREIFGQAAEAIWADERRMEKISQVLDGLNRVKGAPLSEKLAFFEATIRQEYALKADAFIRDHQSELLDRFLGMESVQADLKRMQPQDRRQALLAVRKALGMDEATLKRLDELEKIRDQRWEKGLAYLKERRRIVGTSQGEARERMLDELRARYFGPDAPVIAGEEASGFSRFAARRVYGKN
ncbi:MAG TPA: hypothetical protein PK600_08495 [Deltaproteobacteria bacterium]|nr:hypothetical protein [Deltaproteobacteria bacterium]